MSESNDEPIHENNEPVNESNNQPNSQSIGPNSDHASTFVERLEKYKRVSKDVWAEWDSLQATAQDATAKIFADEGDEVWFAYYLVKNDTKTVRGKKSKRSSRILLEDLESRPAAYQRGLAKRISTAISPETRRKAKKLFDRKTRVRPGQTTMTQHGDEGQRVVEHCDPVSSNDLPSSVARLNDAAAPLQSTLISPGTTLPAAPLELKQDSFYKADIRAASTLFEGELYAAIERRLDSPETGYTASISMVFTYHFLWEATCVMALDITPNMVSYFAREWFGVPFRTKSGVRYLSFASGSSQVSASSDFLLEGCNPKAMASFLTDEMMQAIVMNPLYINETEQHLPSTSSISMKITGKAEEKATIYLSLNLMLGTAIKAKLFPQYQIIT